MLLSRVAATHDAPRDLVDVGLATLDVGLRLRYTNDQFLRQVGREPSELYGQHVADLLDPVAQQSLLQRLDGVATGREERFTSAFQASRWGSHCFSGRMTALAGRGGGDCVEAIVLLVRTLVEGKAGGAHVSRQRQLSELDALVLTGVAAGRSTVQLAADLFLSRQGVEYHVGSMLRRYKCANRPALVAKAYAEGVLIVGQWPPKVNEEYIR